MRDERKYWVLGFGKKKNKMGVRVLWDLRGFKVSFKF
jgi:hypothetical protein